MLQSPSPPLLFNPSDSPTATHLKRIAIDWPRVLNERDVYFHSGRGQKIVSCIAPDFKATLDGYPNTLDWYQLLGIWEQEYHDYPDCSLRVKECHADVDEEEGVAEVYLDMDMVFQPGIDLKAYTRLHWTREGDGRWFIRTFHGMRGHAGGAGFV